MTYRKLTREEREELRRLIDRRVRTDKNLQARQALQAFEERLVKVMVDRG